jgi:hypothetical protein
MRSMSHRIDVLLLGAALVVALEAARDAPTVRRGGAEATLI